MTSSGVIPEMMPSTVALAPMLLAYKIIGVLRIIW